MLYRQGVFARYFETGGEDARRNVARGDERIRGRDEHDMMIWSDMMLGPD
jgi:hypothetical protein